MGAAKAIQSTRRRQIPSKHITVGGTALPAPLMVPESISVAMYVMNEGAMRWSTLRPISGDEDRGLNALSHPVKPACPVVLAGECSYRYTEGIYHHPVHAVKLAPGSPGCGGIGTKAVHAGLDK